ncbi:MAG: DUF4405 domain-containing protein [Chitinispirillaceae bacterium]|nr:DUF4405 domain-containing protein [Chitinispirillaceae bacterium]
MAINKQTALKIVNPVVAVLFILQAGSGMFHDTIPWEVFKPLHFTAGYLLAAGVIAHVILNWGWFRTALGRRRHAAEQT